MTHDTAAVVPLPDYLSECGCRWAPRKHLTSCKVAREFDAIPLTERPEYEEGRRFAAISWEYPLRLSVRLDVTVEVDPIAYIVRHRDEYEAFPLTPGFAEWEKPICYLSHKIEDDWDPTFDLGFGYPRTESRVDFSMDFDRERPEWTEAGTERLNAALAALPDPNQGDLFGGES